MRSPHWLNVLNSLGLEFWLPLPLLGLTFWVGSNLVTNQVLSRPYSTAAQLQAKEQLLPVQISFNVLAIEAEIKPEEGFTKVEVETTNSAIKELKFEFPVTELSQAEAVIAQELKLSPEKVRGLIRYRLED